MPSVVCPARTEDWIFTAADYSSVLPHYWQYQCWWQCIYASTFLGFEEIRLFLTRVLDEEILRCLKKSLKAFSSATVNALCPPIKSTSNSIFLVFILLILKIFINKFQSCFCLYNHNSATKMKCAKCFFIMFYKLSL